MDHPDMEQVRYIVTILRKHHGITSRTQLRERFDAGAGWAAIKGIGERRALVPGWLMRLPADDWYHVTGLAA